MTDYILSPEARRDMRKIWRYSVDQWDAPKGDRNIRDMTQFITKLSGKPTIGRSCADIRPGYYKAGFESHLVFYRLIENGILVIRILHQSMDFTRHL